MTEISLVKLTLSETCLIKRIGYEAVAKGAGIFNYITICKQFCASGGLSKYDIIDIKYPLTLHRRQIKSEILKNCLLCSFKINK